MYQWTKILSTVSDFVDVKIWLIWHLFKRAYPVSANTTSKKRLYSCPARSPEEWVIPTGIQRDTRYSRHHINKRNKRYRDIADKAHPTCQLITTMKKGWRWRLLQPSTSRIEQEHTCTHVERKWRVLRLMETVKVKETCAWLLFMVLVVQKSQTAMAIVIMFKLRGLTAMQLWRNWTN